MENRFQAFTMLIAKINRNIRKIKAAAVTEFELKSPHVSCLYYLYREHALTASELCAICDEDKAAISRSVDYLEKEGFLTCENKAKKRYKSALQLTEKGLRAGKALAEKIEGVLAQAGGFLSETERTEFYKNLALISDNLQSISDTYQD